MLSPTMRYGLLSDVHANLPALRATLELLRREGVDAYVCAGDIVGYGPYPNECAEVVAGLPGVCVAGNHDLIAVDRLGREGIGELASVTLGWTSTVHRADVRAWLLGLPATAALPGILVTHGALGDVRRYVTTDREAVEQLARLERASPSERVLVLGHTHRALAFGQRSGRLFDGVAGAVGIGSSERWLLNPGAVGQSRDKEICARAAVLDLDAHRVTFHSLRYDVAATRGALRRAGLPPSAVQLRARRSVWSALRRVVTGGSSQAS
jgi:predicted phosphodiesterase